MLLWDFLFFVLVLLPVVTGGIWLDLPGLRLEYTQPAIAALILALWFFWKKKSLAQHSTILHLANKAWSHWEEVLEDKPGVTLSLMSLLFSGIWFFSALARHAAFQSGAADLGIFTNAIFNVSQMGWPYSSLKGGVNLLTDHQIYLLFPLGWIFQIWASPIFLLLVQSLGLCSTGIAVYLLVRQRLGHESKFLPWVPLLLWFYLPIRNANRFDFHPEIFQLPLFLFSAWFLQEKKSLFRLSGVALFLLALCSKESACPVGVGLGVAWLLGAGPEKTRNFTRAFGAFAIVLCAAVFAIDLKIPGLLGAEYSYSNLYGALGASPLALMLSPFLNPGLFLYRLLSPARLKFLFGMLAPLAFFPIFAPIAAVAAIPSLLVLFLMENEQRLSLGFHYSIEPAVGFLFALAPALANPFIQRHEKKILILLPLVVLLSMGRSELYYWRKPEKTAHQTWLAKEILPRINHNASITASSALVPHLATRKWIHFLPILQDENKNYAECVLWEKSINNTPLNEHSEASSRELLVQHYDVELKCRSLEVFRRKNVSTPCIENVPAAKDLCTQ